MKNLSSVLQMMLLCGVMIFSCSSCPDDEGSKGSHKPDAVPDVPLMDPK